VALKHRAAKFKNNDFFVHACNLVPVKDEADP
jgi:hypothetical protein